MRTTVIALALTALASLIPATTTPQKPTPSVPDTGTLSGTVLAATTTASFPAAEDKAPASQQATQNTAQTEPQPVVAERTAADMVPVRLSIPSIKLNDPIQKMGVLANGELNVPSGKTNNVGWYAAGTVPGQEGSAVLDAHVFAAFKNLRYAQPGDSIYVTDADGTVLHFVIQTSEVFKLGDLSADYLYNRNDAKRLTLITCAGKLTPDHSTYDHRLVVSAVLVNL